ncbi:MAG: benzoate transporter [Candidatus Nephthysia bennettiae]|uniref:Benzoate/H(+) symporter BenE family transporter n=1 Tax=Candidatus Nephthysia bennettiae TaxID=3127016 RepID=A0A934K4T4_9BACT|nr:benzoate/H(+) symporter BenE family transporter [Candidatus Dormibacteraeota bacterium]PZR96673.1 MAG: benzoate transporter [Candidatus Dormibacteraeota bacterium]
MVVVLAAAHAGHLTSRQTTSWILAISLGSGLTCIVLSLWTRMPVITAWSTPGAALLVTSLPFYNYGDAIGAFVLAAIATTAVGFSGMFGKLIARVPTGIVSAMLAGILFSFGTEMFQSLGVAPLVVSAVLVGYLVVKRFSARYAVVCALGLGVLAAALSGRLRLSGLRLELAMPQWTTPTFSLAAMIGIGLPLFIVTMASQNAPGLAVLRAAGYRPNDRLLIGSTGLTSIGLAPLGCHAINLAAITAAICTNAEAHPDPRRRYVAGVVCGLFYLLVGLFGAGLLVLFTGLPKELIAAVAGVALLGALMSGLSGSMEQPDHREAAMVTLLVTASGLSLFNVGSTFWGLVLGLITHLVLAVGRRKPMS